MRNAHFVYATVLQECADSKTVYTIVVTEEIARLEAKWSRFAKLLDHPVHGRAVCRGPVNDFSAAMIENKKDVQRREVDCRGREEVECPGYVKMTAKERQPSR